MIEKYLQNGKSVNCHDNEITMLKDERNPSVKTYDIPFTYFSYVFMKHLISQQNRKKNWLKANR